MTTWGTVQVAKWARDAGFTGEALYQAVAIAMAVTGGADHHVSNVGYTPELARRGLWALRADEWVGPVQGDLFDPAYAAKTLYAAWEAHGKTWGWHPGWTSGAAPAAVDTVRAMLNHPSASTPAGPARSFSEGVARAKMVTDALKQAGSASGP
jgi:hypothetical protein